MLLYYSALHVSAYYYSLKTERCTETRHKQEEKGYKQVQQDATIQYFSSYFNILHPVVCNFYTGNSEGRQHNNWILILTQYK
jgi:hypothetical protein